VGDAFMPIYEYECKNCKRRFELFQKFTDEPLKCCSYCGGSIYKVYHPVGIIFKGSGFYTTDYKKPTERKEELEDKTAALKTESKKFRGEI